ncbi:hypothetical protein C0J52_18965 [Blattella germanica]|nr:hypothetical protein C0J52_18965 [Blattella germanica]
MGIVFESILLDIGALIVVLLLAIYIRFKKAFTYWKKKNVPYIEPIFPFGNFADAVLVRRSFAEMNKCQYKSLEGHDFGGFYIFTKPAIMFRDPELIKTVLVKDFSSFHDRGIYINEEVEPLTGHLFILPGARWRNLRVKLSPTFTSGKMKMMFQTLVDCGIELQDLVQNMAKETEVIEIKDILARYGTDVISSYLPIDSVAAQAFVFFAAGFETSSTTMTFCLYELALNPDIQDRVRKEILKVLDKHDGKITYESILEMSYLDQVVSETLRKYPPVPILNRECTNEYMIPGTDVVIEKGTPIVIPVVSLQHDPKHYPNPEKFDPDRFTEEEIQKRHPYVYLPFGEGPRICIGMRFGLMQTKVGLVSILSKFEIGVSEKTSIPLVMNKMSFILAPKGGMWLKITKRS